MIKTRRARPLAAAPGCYTDRSVPHKATATDETQSDSPPILGTWRNVYLVVLLHLAAWILLLYLFTSRYLPDGQ